MTFVVGVVGVMMIMKLVGGVLAASLEMDHKLPYLTTTIYCTWLIQLLRDLAYVITQANCWWAHARLRIGAKHTEPNYPTLSRKARRLNTPDPCTSALAQQRARIAA